MCAIAGFQPFPDLTLRELIAAAKAKQRCDWDHTSDLLAMLANIHSKNRYQREHFHPLRETPETSLSSDDPAETYYWILEQERKRGSCLN